VQLPAPTSWLFHLDRERIILPNQRHPQSPINGRPRRSKLSATLSLPRGRSRPHGPLVSMADSRHEAGRSCRKLVPKRSGDCRDTRKNRLPRRLNIHRSISSCGRGLGMNWRDDSVRLRGQGHERVVQSLAFLTLRRSKSLSASQAHLMWTIRAVRVILAAVR